MYFAFVIIWNDGNTQTYMHANTYLHMHTHIHTNTYTSIHKYF